jgi:antitoxin component HigA of HigAB toxin-antitoxin module
MGFHERYISNEHIIKLFDNGNIEEIIQLYTRGVDALITEIGLASKISEILKNYTNLSNDHTNFNQMIIDIIHKELGINDLKE